MMTWTKFHLESMNILQLRELKRHVDSVLEKNIQQSERMKKLDKDEKNCYTMTVVIND